MPDFRNVFHAPYYVIHRADFHTALHRRALDLGVSIKLASRVTEYNPQSPSIFLESGTTVSADLIVAADGSFFFVTICELF
jgi:salicylate hydroxylase